MPTCIICFDDMDMEDFNDPRDRTDTCFKLQCGHAYHTNCLVRFLQETNHKCAHCNEHKTPERRLLMRGVIQRNMARIRAQPEVRAVAGEMQIAKRELQTTGDQIRKDVREFAKRRAQELGFKEKRDYYTACERAVTSAQKVAAKRLGLQYVGTMQEMPRHYRWRRWRTIHPRIYLTL